MATTHHVSVVERAAPLAAEQGALHAVAIWTCLAFTVVIVVLVITLYALRNLHALREARSGARRRPLRHLLLTYATGEPDDPDAVAAYAELLALSPRARRDAEPDAYALLNHLRGVTRTNVIDLVVAWGGTRRALSLATSRLVTRRCRGLHRSGLLAQAGSLPTITAALADPHPLVRRVALDACATYGPLAPLDAMTQAVVADRDLRRDYLATLAVLGSDIADAVRERLAQAAAPDQLVADTDTRSEEGFTLRLLCEASGVVRDWASGRHLVTVLDHLLTLPDDPTIRSSTGGDSGLVAAAVQALGRVGNPGHTPVLRKALTSADPRVRRAAAAALGELASPNSVAVLGALTDDADLSVARAAATALAACGPRGTAVLTNLDTPAAIEARALPTWTPGPARKPGTAPRPPSPPQQAASGA
ncbi:MAG: hypothetical protein JWN84_4667 [Nocardioides sp.]|nr:hypothetical protein [Nocardioides sp.]